MTILVLIGAVVVLAIVVGGALAAFTMWSNSSKGDGERRE